MTQMNMWNDKGHYVIEVDDAIYTQCQLKRGMIDRFEMFSVMPIEFSNGLPRTIPDPLGEGLHFKDMAGYPWGQSDYFLQAAKTFTHVEKESLSGTHLVGIAWSQETMEPWFMRYAGKVVGAT